MNIPYHTDPHPTFSKSLAYQTPSSTSPLITCFDDLNEQSPLHAKELSMTLTPFYSRFTHIVSQSHQVMHREIQQPQSPDNYP
jgi:hypothetical protein